MTAPFPVPPFTAEGVPARPLAPAASPRRLVVVRLQAFGDAIATLPVLGALRERFPSARLEVVTGPPCAAVFAARSDVDRVHVFDARAPRLAKAAALAVLAARLRRARVDAVLDFQRSRLSTLLLRLVAPRAWAAHDRFAPRHGLDRYLDAAEALAPPRLTPLFAPRIRDDVARKADARLRDAGRDASRPLVCLNPAGGWRTKQWPLERYVELGTRLAAERNAQILLLGAGDPLPRVKRLASELGRDAVDLAGATTPEIAMAVLARATLAISDDSGLMHLAWAQGVPTLGLFGSSRATWSRPVGPATDGFYSEDLSCGACMQPECARGDLHCLARVSVDDVLARVHGLLPGP